MTDATSKKPPRTLGLSIAILASLMLFTILPLLQVSLIYAVQYRFSSINLPDPGDSSQSSAPIATGGTFSGANDAILSLQIVLGMAYLPLAVMAWRGRPRSIRIVIIGTVIVLMVVTAVFAVATLTAPQSPQFGMDSGRDVERSLLISRTVFSALIALYVVWYMNRGPARAFYRGYYLPESESEAAPI